MKHTNHVQSLLIIGSIVTMAILSIVYMIVAIIAHANFPEYSLWKLFLIYASGNNVDVSFGVMEIYALLALSRILESFILAIISSFAFTIILNGDIKLVFPDKLVIRKRTSEGTDGLLSVGILIGNPRKYKLYDVECCINCSYVKEKGEIITRNNEVTLTSHVKLFQNYYRFSFPVKKFHKKFWKDYLERDREYMDSDYITVTISGHTNTLGGTFIVEKQYNLSDIGIDLRNPENDFKRIERTRFTGKTRIRIDWSEFPRFMEASEKERAKIIEEIKQYVNS